MACHRHRAGALNLIAEFSWSTLYRFWALIVIAINVVIIYALLVHGGELKAFRPPSS